MSRFGLSYVHLVEPRSDDMPLSALTNVSGSRPDTLAPFRQVGEAPDATRGGLKRVGGNAWAALVPGTFC